jgi:hypothetical protein
MEWRGFDRVLPNCVYSIHDYSRVGVPLGDPFKGTLEQVDQLERQFTRKISTKNKYPVGC